MKRNNKSKILFINAGEKVTVIDERTGKRYPVQVVPKGLRLGKPELMRTRHRPAIIQ